MLMGVTIEFKVVPDVTRYAEIEGAVIGDNDNYRCTGAGDHFYVFFKASAASQVAIITPDWHANMDPDGGTEFIRKNVIALADALTSKAQYI